MNNVMHDGGGGKGSSKGQILCEALFAQDWPNLRWGQFTNIEVDSIILNKLWY